MNKLTPAAERTSEKRSNVPEKPQQPASIKELGIYSPDKPIVDKKDNISNKESEKKPEEPA